MDLSFDVAGLPAREFRQSSLVQFALTCGKLRASRTTLPEVRGLERASMYRQLRLRKLRQYEMISHLIPRTEGMAVPCPYGVGYAYTSAVFSVSMNVLNCLFESFREREGCNGQRHKP